MAAYELQSRKGNYQSPLWNVIEYLSLFLIVLLHEFGHSLACRSVGGKADQIVLWPLGGVAYVKPPPRPGATLWSIAAGPLVNVILFCVLTPMLLLASGDAAESDPAKFLQAIWFINTALLIFNLLPVYPLDGGQILQSLLWFWLGRARSLMVAAIIGFIGVAGLLALAFLNAKPNYWMGIIAVFVGMNCWRGLSAARSMLIAEKIPRHQGLQCPTCHAGPPIGEYWKCGECGTAFDLFECKGCCPNCGCRYRVTNCLFCGSPHELESYSQSEQS